MIFDIANKSKEIQSIISRYTKESFVAFFADFIRNNNFRGNSRFSEIMKSKLKDSLYLIALRLSCKEEGKEDFKYNAPNDIILADVIGRLNNIISNYLSSNYTPSYLDGDVKEQKKLIIHEGTFNSYFLNGVLNYRQQEINHVVDMFMPYKDKIKETLGIELSVLIDMCNYSESLYSKKVKNGYAKIVESPGLLNLFNQTSKVGFADIDELLLNLSPNDFNLFMNFKEKPHSALIFTKSEFFAKFSTKEVDVFCNLFSIDINDDSDYLFYTDTNPLELKPIIKLNDKEYLNIYQKQLPTSLYKVLYDTLGVTQKEKTHLNHRRGKVVFEKKVITLFNRIFSESKDFRLYDNYYFNGNEQDVLIICNNYAFIIECKSSKIREPLRNTEKAYKKIKSEFKDCIQAGYNQCYRVEKHFYNEQEVIIKDKTGKVLEIIKTESIKDVFSLVITLERFGPIQTDLSLLLEREFDSLVFPWSVGIDDLEIFLLTLKKKTKDLLNKFVEYLTLRESLNEKIISSDELDICASYIKNPKKFKEIANSNHDFILMEPTLQNYFDELYYKGLLKFN